jgi:hypothetical protein
MKATAKIQLSLLLLRLSVVLVFLIWTVDKFLNPSHAAAVFETFYFMPGLGKTVVYAIGTIQLIIVAGFAIGFQKTITYGAVLAMHAVSTLSAFSKYLNPYDGSNILFFAAWPMLAACLALFLLRDWDQKWTVS